MSVAAEHTREPLGERAARATGMAAVEAPDRQLQPNDLAARWQIRGPSLIAAMDHRAECPTGWAAGVIALAFRGAAEGFGAVPSDMKQAAAG